MEVELMEEECMALNAFISEHNYLWREIAEKYLDEEQITQLEELLEGR